jgi:hypothetical protein
MCGCGMDSSNSEFRVWGSCEHGNEYAIFIKGGEFLDYLSDY